MSHEPLDADGLVIPSATPSAAWTAVMGLRSVSAGARELGRQLAGAPTVAAAWAGPAEAGYRQRRAALSARVADLAVVAEQGATVIHDWLVEADSALIAMRAGRDQVAAARAGEAAANAAGRYGTPDVNQANHAAWSAWTSAKRRYWDGVDTTGARLGGLRAGLTDHPLDATEQVDAFFAGTVGQFGPALVAGWGLTGEVFVDPKQWWRTVSAVPGALWGGVTQAVEHPVATLKEAVDLDGWQHGRYGEAMAVATMAAVPGPGRLGRAVEADAAGLRIAARVADATLPRPRLQTLDEMVGKGVDLEAHEHATLGHTIRRHVDTGAAYLADRLRNGTLLDDGSRGHAPPRVSSFTDLETANASATAAIRAHEEAVRAYCEKGTPGTPLMIKTRVNHPVGHVMTPLGDRFRVEAGHEVVVYLQLTPDRQLYVETAFVNP